MLKMGKKKSIIRVIDIQGVITSKKSMSNRSYNHYNTLGDLHDAQISEKVLGVILRINSPGGSAGASSELADQILALKEKKPVFVSISDHACSGAYLAASAATKIYLARMGIVGSIGVLMQIPDLQGVAEKVGFEMRTFKSTKHKDIGNPFRDMTDEEVNIINNLLDETHTDFANAVAKNRNLATINFDDGAIFNSETARSMKLIDEIGTYYDAVADLLKTIGKDEDSVEFEHDNENTGLMGKILSKISLEGILPSMQSDFLLK